MCTTWRHCYGPYNHPHTRHACPCGRLGPAHGTSALPKHLSAQNRNKNVKERQELGFQSATLRMVLFIVSCWLPPEIRTLTFLITSVVRQHTDWFDHLAHSCPDDSHFNHGNTALHEASWKGYSRSVAALGKARANLHLKNCGGFAALHLCCQNGHNQSCRELLLAGCNPDLQNNYGDTPLHTSARYGHAGVTRILISAQCRVSDQNKNGDTALHIAAAMGRRKLTRILLEAGCDKNLKNKQNETAKDIATRKDLNEILVILNNPPNLQSKSKSKKNGHDKDRNDKKRGKNESGTSSKDSSSRQKEKKKQKNTHKVHFERPTGKQWSPYGCHYYPDPKSFPQPNLDSLPHEPLKKGEQYYLDLAGNICKGPVGVGYTCYCAPFFRHMEARLDRDKQELKEHIDQAHQRLDQKVSSLERRTQGQLSELTRCVVAERALCDQRHLHLAQWLNRGTAGRSSERVRGTDPLEETVPIPVPRARSLEHLLDHQTHWKDQKNGELPNGDIPGINKGLRNGQDHRSLEMLADDDSMADWRRNQYRNSAHELPSRDQKLKKNDMVREGIKQKETLLDRDVASWRSQPHRRSAHEIPASRLNIEKQRKNDIQGEASPDWRGEPLRRSVHEMVARFQSAQTGQVTPNWKIQNKQKSAESSKFSEVKRNEQSHEISRFDESSEGEDEEEDGMLGIPEPGNPDYENVMASCQWRAEESRLMSGLPYRSRNAVYSPTHEPADLHNDSGYSTKLYGSSKGPSPSLSGQLDCDGLLPGQNVFPPKLPNLCDHPAPVNNGAPRNRYERGEESAATNIVAASLV
ncbi:hypothetical protein L9F63_006847, partial [Diploptera punctata]